MDHLRSYESLPDWMHHLESVYLENGSRFVLVLSVLCVVAYLPAFNNGFISDDYVILGRLDALREDPLCLFSEPPECFRSTSYIAFGILRFLFGYSAPAYYGFTLLLHIANSLLVWRLVSRASDSAQTGTLAALLFATAQGHQEAIMWLAAMNEALLGFFLLSCLLSWEGGRSLRSPASYLAALFSKESALMLIGLLPWFGRASNNREPQVHRRIAYVIILSISSAFVALLLSLSARNFMLSTKAYSFGFHAIAVFLTSMHRLLFPWIYLAFAILVFQRQRARPAVPALRGLGFAGIALLPYVFITYQNHITSRQEYLASVGIAWALASLVQGFKTRTWRNVFILVFVAANIGYIWFRKDAQFEERAAPTNQLLAILRDNPPQDLVLIDFPGKSWIAKNVTRLVPGWRMELIHVDSPGPPPRPGRASFRWDPVAKAYLRQGISQLPATDDDLNKK